MKRRWLSRLAALIAGALCCSVLPAMAEKRVALIIGNSSYQNIGRLANPANDARLIAGTLRSLGFALVGDGPLLDLDRTAMERAVRNFGQQLRGADVGLFYYAGHALEVRKSNYLVPVSANPSSEADVDFEMLDMSLVLLQMESAGTKLNLVMLDACRNNPFAGRGLRSSSSGLAQMQAPQGTMISFATQPGNVAQDGNDGNSPYTKALAEAIRKPGLDIFRTFNQVGLAVSNATGGAQQPWLASSPIKGDFYFAGPVPAPAGQIAAVTPPSAPALPPQSLPRPAAGVFPPAERNVELKFSHWVPTAHPLHGTIQSWADSIKRASNGTIDVKVFPAQQLGKALDHYNMARDGIADITFVNPAYEPTRFPIVSRLELPFTATNATAGSVALDAWYRKYAGREMRDVKYCLSFAHDPGTLHTTKKKVVLPSDVRGMKIRPSNAVLARLVTMLGGTNVQASAPEIRGSLEKGASEGVTSPWGSVTLFGIDRVTRFHLDAPLYVSVFNWVIHPATYNALSPAQRAVLDNHCTSEWAERVARPWSDYESSGRSKVRAQPGHDIYTLSPAQIAEWRRALLPLKAEWEATVRRAGHDPVAIASDLEGELRKRNSLY